MFFLPVRGPSPPWHGRPSQQRWPGSRRKSPTALRRRLFAFQRSRIVRQGKADGEKYECDEAVDRERRERRIVDRVGGAQKLAEPDDGRQRGAFDELDQEPDGRRSCEREGLRQDDEAKLGRISQPKTGGGGPLSRWNGFHAAPPDFGEEGARAERQSEHGRSPGLDPKSQQRQPEKDQEELEQQRCSLEERDIALGELGEPEALRDPRNQDRQSGAAPAQEGGERQEDRPAR